MNAGVPEDIEGIVNAVLYEGFLLYPYRASALKNRQRWSFGVLYPPAFSAVQREREMAQTECLLEDKGHAALDVCLRFLQIDGASVAERAVHSGFLIVRGLAASAWFSAFCFGKTSALLLVSAERLEGALFKITARISNTAAVAPASRDEALAHSLISAHLVLSLKEGRFFSAIDPPEAVRDRAAQCRNTGLWPVLAGNGDSQMLAAPIILYDHPRTAPQSPGDLFDGTEIDELLTLRIRTLTDEEKGAMRAADWRTQSLLERTEGLSERAVSALHGALQMPPTFAPGERVRLRPRTGARTRTDIFDLVLEGALATVLSVEQDIDGRTYVCVAVENDPGKDLALEGKPGHRFFFAPEEVERVSDE